MQRMATELDWNAAHAEALGVQHLYEAHFEWMTNSIADVVEPERSALWTDRMLLLASTWIRKCAPDVPLILCDHLAQLSGGDANEHRLRTNVRIADRDDEQDTLVVLRTFWSMASSSREGRRMQAKTALWMLENLTAPSDILALAVEQLARNTDMRLLVRNPGT